MFRGVWRETIMMFGFWGSFMFIFKLRSQVLFVINSWVASYLVENPFFRGVLLVFLFLV